MLSIRAVDPQGDDAMALLREAALDARALYPDLIPADAPFPTNSALPERGAYVVAYVDEQPLACGALWPYEVNVAEVRRMYVHREHRRGGLARAVLAHLLGVAREFGYSRIVLETGVRQSAAMQLYEGLVSSVLRRSASTWMIQQVFATSWSYLMPNRLFDTDAQARLLSRLPLLAHLELRAGQLRRYAAELRAA